MVTVQQIVISDNDNDASHFCTFFYFNFEILRKIQFSIRNYSIWRKLKMNIQSFISIKQNNSMMKNGCLAKVEKSAKMEWMHHFRETGGNIYFINEILVSISNVHFIFCSSFWSKYRKPYTKIYKKSTNTFHLRIQSLYVKCSNCKFGLQ